jgi:hypothetical protein
VKQPLGFFTANILPTNPSKVFKVTVIDVAVQTKLTEEIQANTRLNQIIIKEYSTLRVTLVTFICPSAELT